MTTTVRGFNTARSPGSRLALVEIVVGLIGLIVMVLFFGPLAMQATVDHKIVGLEPTGSVLSLEHHTEGFRNKNNRTTVTTEVGRYRIAFLTNIIAGDATEIRETAKGEQNFCIVGEDRCGKIVSEAQKVTVIDPQTKAFHDHWVRMGHAGIMIIILFAIAGFVTVVVREARERPED